MQNRELHFLWFFQQPVFELHGQIFELHGFTKTKKKEELHESTRISWEFCFLNIQLDQTVTHQGLNILDLRAVRFSRKRMSKHLPETEAASTENTKGPAEVADAGGDARSTARSGESLAWVVGLD